MLEMVDRRGDYEERLWQFVGSTLKETVLKYQTESEEDAVTTEVKQFTADELGDLLVTAVKDKEVSKVRISYQLSWSIESMQLWLYQFIANVQGSLRYI